MLLGAAIHEPGEYPVAIRLYRDVHANVTVSVVPEGYSADEEAALAELDAELSEGSADADDSGDASDEDEATDSEDA